MRWTAVVVLLACNGGATSLPPDAAGPDACPAQNLQACSVATDTRCTNARMETCSCYGYWLCNPSACPDMASGPPTGACTQPGLECSTGELSVIRVAPEDVWVGCNPFTCAYTRETPKDGDPCCKLAGSGADICTAGCTTCACTDLHWRCDTRLCPDAG